MTRKVEAKLSGAAGVLRDRRVAIKAIGGTALALFACGGASTDDSDAAATGSGSGGTGGTSNGGTGGAGGAATSPDAAAATCTAAPEETMGPYPDKTGMLSNPTYNRRDITEGRAGLQLDVVLSVVNISSGCAAVAGAAVIIWQCDAEGHYSEYSGQPGGYDGSGATFLRGVQIADGNGQVTFRTIYPGWYQGRATHIHVQVFVDGISKKITQLAFPETVTATVYGAGVYAAKGLNPQSNASDMVFADSLQSELATLRGDTTNGYTAALTVGVAA